MAPESGNPLSYTEHHDLGGELRRTHRRLLELKFMADTVYGSGSPAAVAFTDAADSTWRLLREMQRQAEADCPGMNADEFYR